MDASVLKRRRGDVLLSDQQRFARGAILAGCVGALCWVCLFALL